MQYLILYNPFDEQNWHPFMYISVLAEITAVVLLSEGGVNGIRWSSISSVLHQPFVSSVQISLHSNVTRTVPTQQKRQMASSVRQPVSLVNIFPPSNSFWILIRSEKHSRKFAESSFGKMDWTFAAHLNPIRWTESYFHTRSIFVMLWFQLKPNSDAHLDGTMNGQLQIVETL